MYLLTKILSDLLRSKCMKVDGLLMFLPCFLSSKLLILPEVFMQLHCAISKNQTIAFPMFNFMNKVYYYSPI